MKSLWVGLFFFLGTCFLYATDEPNIMVDMDRGQMTLGSRATIVVKVFLPVDAQVKHFNREHALGGLELKDFVRYKAQRLDDGRLCYRYDYIVTAYGLGEYSIEPFVCDVQLSADQAITLQSEGLSLKVVTVMMANDQGLDIKDDLLAMQPQAISWWVIVLIVLILLLLIVAGYCFYRYRKKIKPKPVNTLVLIAEDIEALQDLSQLRNCPPQTQKALYHAVTSILRHYLERRFAFPAEESTSFELVSKLKAYVNKTVLKAVRDLNHEADLVKFAKQKVEENQCIQAIEKVEWIVNQTKRVVEEPQNVHTS